MDVLYISTSTNNMNIILEIYVSWLIRGATASEYV